MGIPGGGDTDVYDEPNGLPSFFLLFFFNCLTFGFPSCVGEVFGKVLIDDDFTEVVSLVGDAVSCPGSCVDIPAGKQI